MPQPQDTKIFSHTQSFFFFFLNHGFKGKEEKLKPELENL